VEEIRLNIFGIIGLFGTVQGLILSLIFLFNKNYKRKSNQYLSIQLLTFSILNMLGVIYEGGFFNTYPALNYIPTCWYSLIAPTLFFFTNYLTNPKFKPSIKHYLLFLPFAIDLLLQFTGNLYFGLLMKNTQLTSLHLHHSLYNIFESIAVVMTTIVLIFSLKKLSSYEQSLYQQYAEINDKSLKWLKSSLACGLAVVVIWSVSTILEFFPSLSFPILERLLWGGLSFMIYWIGYGMLIRRELFLNEQSVIINHSVETEAGLSEKAEEHFQNLLILMEEKQLYKNPDISMTALSKEIGLSKGYLSQIINVKEAKNFFDFINSYRVDAVIKLFKDPKFSHYSILGITIEAGFKSKSTFNAVFKKTTGLTPSQYRKQDK